MLKKDLLNHPLAYIMRKSNEDKQLLEEKIKNNSTANISQKSNISIGGKRKLKKKTRKLKKK